MPAKLSERDFTRNVLEALNGALAANQDWASDFRKTFDRYSATVSDRLARSSIPPLRGMGALLGQSPKIGDTINVRHPDPEPWNLDHELLRFGLRYTPNK